MPLNLTSIRTSSDGAWQGENPLNYAFPLLILQTTLVLFTSRFLAFLIKPLRQPTVIAEIVGGILLGPSALGRNKEFLNLVFPSWSTPILESVASIGLLFFLFLVGLELDLTSIRQNGRKAFIIALAGITLPFLFGAGVSIFLKKAVYGENKVGYGQLLLFIGVSLSVTAFPVLARILGDLKLLTTQIGQTAMAAAAFNDVAAWILLALAITLAGNGSGNEAKQGSLVSIYVLISGVAFVVFMLLVVRPIMEWVARQSSSERDSVEEIYICLTLAGVMLSGFLTDLIGIHAIFGAFIFGLTVPKGGEFGVRLMMRIQDFVSSLLLPLYFASSGLKTDLTKIRGAESWGLLVLVISLASAGKVLGTFLMALLCSIPVRESLALGVLMNTKGLVELIVLNIGREKKVLNDEMFAILVLMALFTTIMTTPTLLAVYKPLRRVTSQAQRRLERQKRHAKNSQDEFRILACIHGPESVPSLINFTELIRSAKISPLKVYIMHLIELTNRPSSVVMVQKTRKNGFPFINRFRRGMSNDHIVAAFEVYSQIGRVIIRHSTSVSALLTMHEDIFHVAEDKRVEMIILPFHKQWRGEGAEVMDNVWHGWRQVNWKVLQSSPCSVAVLVDRGFGSQSEKVVETAAAMPKRICVVYFGGPDDRKALELGGRIAEHTEVKLTLLRFLEKIRLESSDIEEQSPSDTCIQIDDKIILKNHKEKELDEAAVEAFREKWNQSVVYEEKEIRNITEQLLTIGKSWDYELVLVGKGMFPSNIEAKFGDNEADNVELGPIGNILASTDHGIRSSVLVIQQHIAGAADQNEPTACKRVSDNNGNIIHEKTAHESCL